MLGRGTASARDKQGRFTIFDCFDGTLIDYFKNATDFRLSPAEGAGALEQVIENIYQNVDREYYTKILVKRLRRIGREMSGGRGRSSLPLSDGDMGKFADELQERLKTDFSEP